MLATSPFLWMIHSGDLYTFENVLDLGSSCHWVNTRISTFSAEWRKHTSQVRWVRSKHYVRSKSYVYLRLPPQKKTQSIHYRLGPIWPYWFGDALKNAERYNEWNMSTRKKALDIKYILFQEMVCFVFISSLRIVYKVLTTCTHMQPLPQLLLDSHPLPYSLNCVLSFFFLFIHQWQHSKRILLLPATVSCQ